MKISKIKTVTLLFIIISMIGCTKSQSNKTEEHNVNISTKSEKSNSLGEAQEIYDKRGFNAYKEYVEKMQKYYPVTGTSDGLSPLLLSLQNNDVDATCLFLKNGAGLTEKDSDGKDFLDYFMKISDITAKVRIANEISIELWQQTIEREGYLNAIEFILDNDIEIEVFSSLVKKGLIDPDYAYSRGKTVLMYAAQRNTNVKILDCLLTHAKKVDAKDDNKWTAVMYAARYNPNPEILEQFILKRANLESNEFGITLAMLSTCNPNPGVLLKVPNIQNEINLQTIAGKTALMYACENGQALSTIIMLVKDLGADVNVADAEGKTALIYASSSYDDIEVMKYLMESGATIDNINDEGNNPNFYLE